MEQMKKIYQDELIYIFTKNQCLDLKQEYLVIVKDDCHIQEIENCLIMHYQDDFESLLKFNLPTKMRKTKQLLSYHQSLNIIHEKEYGVLSFSVDDLPYSIGLNHIYLDGRLFFHCAKKGYKLNGIGKRATFLIVDDLGINLKAGTHNHQSVIIYGRLKETKDFETKKMALLKIIEDLVPQHPYHDNMVSNTNVLELEIDYIIGKTHIR